MRGRGGSTPNRRGGSPLSTQRQNFFSAVKQQVLVKRISRDGDLDPLAAPRDDRKRRRPGVRHPHVVLQLGHMLLGRRLLGKRPRQHEFGLEHRPAAGHHAVQRRPHPPQHRVPEPMLDAFDGLPGIALVPEPVEVLGHEPQLDDQVAGEVLWLGLAPLLAPEPGEGGLVVPHDDAGVRAADEAPALGRIEPHAHAILPAMSSAARWMAPVTSDARSARSPSASRRSSAAGDILRRIVEDHGHIDRQRAEHLV